VALILKNVPANSGTVFFKFAQKNLNKKTKKNQTEKRKGL